MNTLLHLLAADGRRFRRAFLLWIVVAITGALLEPASLKAAQPSQADEMLTLATMLVWAADLLLTSALVTLVVQSHPAVGSEAFWMTRPIHPMALVGSKLVLLAVVFLGVPAVIGIATMSAYGIPATDIALVSLQRTFVRGTFLAMVMAVAALTPTAARAVWLAGGVLLFMAVAASVAPMLLRRLGASSPEFVIATLQSSHVPFYGAAPPLRMTAGLVFLVGALAIVVIGYLRRPTRLGWLLGGLTLVLAAVADLTDPFLGRMRAPDAPAWAHEASSLQLTLDPSKVTYRGSRNEWAPPELNRGVTRLALGPVRVRGIEPQWAVTATFAGASLALDAGATLTSLAQPASSMLPDDDGQSSWVGAARRALAVERLDIGRFEDTRATLLVVPEADAARHNGKRGRFTADFRLHLARLDVAATAPLRIGATVRDGSYGLVVDDVTLTDTVLRIRTRAWRVGTMLDRFPRPGYECYLLNRATGIAMAPANLAYERPLIPSLGGLHLDPGSRGFAVGRMEIWYSRGTSRGLPVTEESGYTEAELVLVRTQYHGSVVRTLTVEGFPIEPARPPRVEGVTGVRRNLTGLDGTTARR